MEIMDVPPRGIHTSLNLPGTAASHPKPQTGTTLHHPLESSLAGGKKKKVGPTAFLQRGTYKVVEVLLSLQQQPGMEKAQFHFLLLFVLLESLSFVLQENVITIRQQAILG